MSRLKPRPDITQPDDTSIRLIPLTKGQVVVIDADRYEWVMQWRWCASRSRNVYYAFRNGRAGEPKSILLHRQLAGEPASQVDHINGNSLDCRVQNLRACNRQQNQANRGLQSNNNSGHAGIRRVGSKWPARIYVMGKEIYLGCFDNKEAAIAARVYAELTYFGEFAPSARDLLALPVNLFSQDARWSYGLL